MSLFAIPWVMQHIAIGITIFNGNLIIHFIFHIFVEHNFEVNQLIHMVPIVCLSMFSLRVLTVDLAPIVANAVVAHILVSFALVCL